MLSLVPTQYSYLQCSSVRIESLAIFEQSVAIFNLGDEHVDDKYSKDVKDCKCKCSCADGVKVTFKPPKELPATSVDVDVK